MQRDKKRSKKKLKEGGKYFRGRIQCDTVHIQRKPSQVAVLVLVCFDLFARGGGRRCLRGGGEDNRKRVTKRTERPSANLNGELDGVGRESGAVAREGDSGLRVAELPYLC